MTYSQGVVLEIEFLNNIKFLIENDILEIENSETRFFKNIDATAVTCNRNSNITNFGFYLSLNLEIPVKIIVTWINNDRYHITINVKRVVLGKLQISQTVCH